MNNFFKEEIKEFLYFPTLKSKKKYSMIIETCSNDISGINYKFTELNNKTNKLIKLEILINSQNKKKLHIRQYNYYEKYCDHFIFKNKTPDFDLEISKNNSNNNLNYYQLQDIIFSIFLKDDYYNLYILKDNIIFNYYPCIYKNNTQTSFRDLIQNYFLLIFFNKE